MANKKILGSMQPYFFPYLGYFQLMDSVTHWVVFDTPQYIRHGWVNRNRVLTRGKDEWKYIRIPIKKAPRQTPINQIEISKPDWFTDLVAGLDYYREKQARFYDETIMFLQSATNCKSSKLIDILLWSLNKTTEHLEIETNAMQLASEMNLSQAEHAGQWALEMSRMTGVEAYLNPEGGKDIFKPHEFENADISLQFMRPNLEPYYQGGGAFVPGLSIIDCLMWVGKEGTKNMLANKEISSEASP